MTRKQQKSSSSPSLFKKNLPLINRSQTPPPLSPLQNHTGQFSFGNALKEGFAWGIGTSMARKLFGQYEKQSPQGVPHAPDLEPIKVQVPVLEPAVPSIDILYEKYNQCMEENNNDYNKCQEIFIQKNIKNSE